MTLSHTLLLLLFFSFSSCCQDVPVPSHINDETSNVNQTKKSKMELICNRWVQIAFGKNFPKNLKYQEPPEDTSLQTGLIFYKDSTHIRFYPGEKQFYYWCYKKDSVLIDMKSEKKSLDGRVYQEVPYAFAYSAYKLSEDTLWIAYPNGAGLIDTYVYKKINIPKN